MIDIKRLHELEKEVDTIKDDIRRQVWLVHHIIGRGFKSDRDVLIEIDRIYEMVDEKTNIPYIIIISHSPDRMADKLLFSAVYIKKELFEMTEEELRENQERLSKELEETNQKQFDSLLEKNCGYNRLARKGTGDE